MRDYDWDNYEYFSRHEFACKCGTCDGRADMDPVYIMYLDKLRRGCGFPFAISSGFRCPNHPVEKRKKTPGAHSVGEASDILVFGAQAVKLVRNALAMGVFTGVGINQRGPVETRFVHLDTMFNEQLKGVLRPTMWSY